MTDLVVRAYRPADCDDVRRVCFETGYMGDPIAWQYRDEPSFAHLFCDWYIERFPEHTAVVDLDGRVVGYRLGCPDVRDPSLAAHERAFATRHVLRRALIIRRGTAGFLLAQRARPGPRSVDPGVTGRSPAVPGRSAHRLPAGGAGAGVGRRLVTEWIESRREAGTPGVHLGTWGENSAATAFFTTLGFEAVGPPALSPGFRQRDGSRCTVQWMVREL